MTIHEQQSESFPYAFGKPSHRTRPEQLVGLGIYISISLAFQFLSGLSTQRLSTPYSLFLALGMWALWRRYSLKVLKLELSLFLAQFLFQMAWRFSQPFFVLVALLLLTSNTLVTSLLFWKKEKTSGILYLFPLFWVFYLACVNMISCIASPE